MTRPAPAAAREHQASLEFHLIRGGGRWHGQEETHQGPKASEDVLEGRRGSFRRLKVVSWGREARGQQRAALPGAASCSPFSGQEGGRGHRSQSPPWLHSVDCPSFQAQREGGDGGGSHEERVRVGATRDPHPEPATQGEELHTPSATEGQTH